MKNIAKLIIAVLSICTAQLYAYTYTVRNYLNVPLYITLPLVLGPELLITVPANSSETLGDEHSILCLDIQQIKIIKQGAEPVLTPLKIASSYQDYMRMASEAAAYNGKVKTLSVEDTQNGWGNTMTMRCGNISMILIVEDPSGKLVALAGYKGVAPKD